MATIHPSAVVHKEAVLGDDVEVGPHCTVEAGACLGAGTRLHSGVVIGAGAVLGEGNVLYPYCAVGGRPQILGWDDRTPCGRLVLGDRNVIREYVTIHASMHAGKETRVGHRNLIMVGAHVGHDCQLDDDIVLSNACQISGHCHIEQGVWMAGMAGTHQFVTMHRWAYSAAMTAITHDVPPFMIVSGSYPFRVRGVNNRGIRRAGLDEAVASAIQAAHHRLYRQGGTLRENARALSAEGGHGEAVQAILDAIERSSQHRYGRYLELFR